MTRRSRAPRLLLASLLAGLVALVIAASPALAARSYESQLTEANGTNFENPFGLSIDSSDNLWVSDAHSGGTVSEFDSTGIYQAQTASPPWSGTYTESLAFSQAAGEVFVSDSGGDDLWGINSADAAYSGVDLNAGLGGGCCYIRVAADNSVGEGAGDLYVSTGSKVLRIEASGAAADFSGTAGYISANELTGPFSSAGAIAVDASGNLYVAGGSKIYVFLPSGELSREIEEFEGDPLGQATAIAIDPSNGNIVVAESSAIDEFGSSGESLERITEANGEPFGTLRGLAVNSSGNLYAADAGKQVVDIFGPNAILPKIAYGAVTNQTHTSGTLNASIDLNGGPEVTSCVFEYGPTAAYGSSKSCSPSAPYSSNTSVSADLSSLTTEATYHYRLVLVTANGTARGGDHIFTPHAVLSPTTDPAADVTASSATLFGALEGDGEDVRYYFEWGTGGSLDNQTPASPGTLLTAPTGHQSVSVAIGRLQPGTTYRFRFVASDSLGTSYGSTQTFATLGHYQFSADFGSPGSGDGQFENPSDVAVDSSNGDLYVADTGNHRVVKLDSSGDFLAAWGWGVGGGSTYEVCTGGCQAGDSGTNPGQFEAPTFVEVDNSSGPSRGDVYVADKGRGVVQKFDSSGSLLESWGEGGSIDFTGDGPIEGITVDNDGNLFVASSQEQHWTEVGQDGIFRQRISTVFFSDHRLAQPDGHGIDVNSLGSFYQASFGGVDIAPTGEPGDSIERFVGEHNQPSGLAVDRSTGNLYVDHGTSVYQFSPSCRTGAYECPPSETFGTGHLSGALGLAFDPSSGTLYAANSGDDDIAVFSSLRVPGVASAPATQTSPTSGLLHGHIDPLGAREISDCYFEYGTTPGLEFTVPCEQLTPFSGETDVSAEISGLTPFTSYRFRLVASLADGERFPAYGHELTFTPNPGTPPSIVSTSASAITETAAALHAAINPNLAPTTYVFQYGTSTGYGSNTLPSESIGEDDTSHSVSAPIEGLTPGTTYHYRVIAINFSGAAAGPDQIFTTSVAAAPTTATATGPAATLATAQGQSSDNGSCARLTREMRLNTHMARILIKRARRAANADRSRALRRRAGRFTRRARRLGRQAAQCTGAKNERVSR